MLNCNCGCSAKIFFIYIFCMSKKSRHLCIASCYIKMDKTSGKHCILTNLLNVVLSEEYERFFSNKKLEKFSKVRLITILLSDLVFTYMLFSCTFLLTYYLDQVCVLLSNFFFSLSPPICVV